MDMKYALKDGEPLSDDVLKILSSGETIPRLDRHGNRKAGVYMDEIGDVYEVDERTGCPKLILENTDCREIGENEDPITSDKSDPPIRDLTGIGL